MFQILSTVLEYADHKTLKSCRLVSKSWNIQAGRILASSSWVGITVAAATSTSTSKEMELVDLLKVLETSSNPSGFFASFKVNDETDGFAGAEFQIIMENYGKHLKAFSYRYFRQQHLLPKSTEDGPLYYQLLLHRVLTEWCPDLQEIHIDFDVQQQQHSFAHIYPGFTARLPSLRNIEIRVSGEIPERFQDSLLQIVQNSKNLKIMSVYRHLELFGGNENERLFEKIIGLHDVTRNLTEFMWKEGLTDLVCETKFSDRLKTLTILDAEIDSTNFSIMISPIRTSLKKFEYSDFGCDVNQGLQLKIFEMAIKSLVNLQSLII